MTQVAVLATNEYTSQSRDINILGILTMQDESNSRETKLPSKLADRLKSWERTHRLYFIIHYFVGIIGVLASTLATSNLLGHPRFLSAISAICIAILAFVRPEREHIRFWNAWRILDSAATKYEVGMVGIEKVVEAIDRGEASLLEFDNNYQDDGDG